MAKKRMLDDSLFVSEKIGTVPPLARWVLVGLFANADDQGRLSANAALIRAQTLAYDDVPLKEVEGYLQLLADAGFLQVYEADGQRCIQLLNWWNNQDWMQYANPSKLPSPVGWTDRVRLTVTRGGIVTYNWHRKDGTVVPDTCDRTGRPLPKQAQTPDAGTPPAPKPESRAEGFKFMLDDPPSGPKLQPAETTSTVVNNNPTKKLCDKLGLDPRRFVNGRIPKGTGVNALEVYYEYVSAKEVRVSEYIKDLMAERKIDDLPKWRTVIEAWLSMSYKHDNFTGMMDWYKNGVPAHAQKEGKQHEQGKANGSSWSSRNPRPSADSAGAGSIPLGTAATASYSDASRLLKKAVLVNH